MSNHLEADNIRLEFNDSVILSDIYLQCEAGKITTLLGRNGSGKSCLLQIIMGSLSASSRSVRINRHPIKSAYPDITYLPQFHFIPGHLRIRRVFSDYRVNLEGFFRHFPEIKIQPNQKIRQLSGGERRLIEVYLLIKTPSRFTLLDEPFTQIMPVHMEIIKPVIVAEKSKGFIITDHLYKDILDISDIGYLLRAGKLWPVNSLSDLQKSGYIHAL